MRLPPEAIHEFRAIWRAEYGEELSFDRARAIAERFVHVCYRMLVISDEEAACPQIEFDGSPATEVGCRDR